MQHLFLCFQNVYFPLCLLKMLLLKFVLLPLNIVLWGAHNNLSDMVMTWDARCLKCWPLQWSLVACATTQKIMTWKNKFPPLHIHASRHSWGNGTVNGSAQNRPRDCPQPCSLSLPQHVVHRRWVVRAEDWESGDESSSLSTILRPQVNTLRTHSIYDCVTAILYMVSTTCCDSRCPPETWELLAPPRPLEITFIRRFCGTISIHFA